MSALRVLCSARVTVKSVNSVASVQYARLWYSTKFCLWCCVWCLFRCFIHWHFGVSCASDLCKSKLSFLYLKKNHFTLDIIQGISTAISLLVYFCMSCHWSLLSKKKKKKTLNLWYPSKMPRHLAVVAWHVAVHQDGCLQTEIFWG